MEKILIIQTAFLGDSILTLPMIQKLKERHPDSELHVLCIPATAQVFRASPFVDKTIAIDKKGKQKNLLSFYTFIRVLKKENYSTVYSPHRSFRSALITGYLRPENSFGFSNSAFKEIFGKIIKYEPGRHEVQKNLNLAGISYDEDNWRIQPQLNLPEVMTKPLEFFFVNYNPGSKVIAVAPGSVWNTKKYPIEYFEKVIDHFRRKGYLILMLGGEADREICEKIASKFDEGVNSAAGELSVTESVKILTGTEILISNDSAPAHLGMCAGIKVLTIYCSTIPEFGFYPYNNRSSYLSYDDLSCKPCGIHGLRKCPLETFECAMRLEPVRVIMKVEEMINDRD